MTARVNFRRRGVLSLMAAAVVVPGLAACGSRPPAPRQLDLGPAPAGNAGPPLPRRVDVLMVSASDLLQGPAVVYRLDYADPYTRRAYRDSRWAAPVPTLVAGRLKQLASRADVAAGGQALAPVGVMVDLEDCVQRFSSPTQSEVTLRLTATVVPGPGPGPGAGSTGAASLERQQGRPVAVRRSFEASAPAGGDADGAVRAMAQVVDHLGAELLAWAAGA